MQTRENYSKAYSVEVVESCASGISHISSQADGYHGREHHTDTYRLGEKQNAGTRENGAQSENHHMRLLQFIINMLIEAIKLPEDSLRSKHTKAKVQATLNVRSY